MRVFIGYGYNDRDKWIEEYVIPLVEAMGCQVAHGKAVYGGALPDEVVSVIRSADAMVGFTTRRAPAGPGQFSTHPWVVQELVTAYSQVPSIPYVEVREQGVVSPGGILDGVNAQRIDYDETDRARCLVQVAQALRRLHDRFRVTTIRLGPDALTNELINLIDNPTFVCTYQVLRGTSVSPPQGALIVPIKGALFVKLRGIAEGELVRITVTAAGRIWRSSYELVDTVDVLLRG